MSSGHRFIRCVSVCVGGHELRAPLYQVCACVGGGGGGHELRRDYMNNMADEGQLTARLHQVLEEGGGS